ncbi:hypothetical protein FA09DRAFT_337478 [Tilletiopsis washingtonensis]|uniref:DUF2470 domain-containing protein n=1 Tax=Tilletiopsis washingtonensis TaxID=58919 RepID=A0A316ZE62_9BASI|nr:hypothetical protein FA09DRAFT_337478 [Tilletiopsis washingtonensis]PWN99338.1 hypothetical protein FA09DRAFT_337478 [Tilletiopsis washingtonensis]
MADLKTRASSILAHLNGDHADSLRSIVARSEELPYLPSRARATAIDADGFDVEYTLQHSLASKAEKRRARVAFKQPLKQSGEARAAFVGLSNESAGLWYPVRFGVTPHLPGALALGALLYALSKAYDFPAAQVALMPVLQRYPDAPDWAAWLLRQIGVAHAVESVLMFLYVLKRGGSVVTAAKWAAVHLPVGFPNFFSFRKLNPAGVQKKGKGH